METPEICKLILLSHLLGKERIGENPSRRPKNIQ
jgi:hypothetical protein